VGRAPAVLEKETGDAKVREGNMRKFVCIIAVLFLTAPLLAEDLPDSVFPWGAYSKHRPEAERDEMRDTLGLSFINLAWDSRINQKVIDFMDDGFFVYPNQGPIVDGTNENYFKYAEAHYSIIYANDDTSQYRFHYRNSYGSDPIYGFFPYEYVASDTTVVVLDTLWMKQEFSNSVLGQDTIRYNRRLHMRIDTTGVPADTIVAVLFTYNCKKGGTNRILMDSVTITAGQFADNTPVLVNCGSYTRGTVHDRTSFTIVSTCKTEVYFDYLKIYCPDGEDLIDDGDYDIGIKLSAATLFSGENVSGWYMADEPLYDQFRPMAYIDNLIKVKTDTLGWPDTARVVTSWNKAVLNLTGDFINIAKPEMIWADIYAYYGGQICEDTCESTTSGPRITDYTASHNVFQGGYRHWGEQFALNYAFQEEAYLVNQACRDASKEWWLFPQAFGYIFKTYGCKECDNKWWWRLPTKSELTCNVFMGLCYGARGIIFWKYHGVDNDEVFAPGLTYPAGDSVTPGWYAVKEMAPYIEAIGQTLRELEWEAVFSCSLSSQTFSGYVNSLSGYSEGTNPDLGWFQVGEFTDGTDPYIIVVNRACNVDSVTLAPDVNCVVRLNPSAVGSNYVYIIDLADSLYRDTTTGEWVGVPDTTYTAKMPDGTIPFTTVLGPGEGRLFKIVQTSEKELSGNIATQYNYQGRIQVTGDITIPTNETMEIFGPARFEFFRCDGDTAGIDTARIEFTLNGALKAIGTTSDSKKFVSDTLFNCNMTLSVNPEEGDWYGIFDKSSDHDTLSYCAIQWAVKGYFADSASNALLYHCNISKNDSANIYVSSTDDDLLNVDFCSIQNSQIGIEMREDAKVTVNHSDFYYHYTMGIYNYRGYLALLNSTIERDSTYGLFGYQAVDSVYNTKFVNNDLCGIKIYDLHTSGDSSYFLYDTISCSSFPSQSGILIEYNDKVRIEGCKIRSYDDALIKLNHSDALITDCDLTFNLGYGLYCMASSPIVRDCLFDSLSTGVYNFLFGTGIADLGKNIEGEYGYNSILDSDGSATWLIYFTGFTAFPQVYTLYAQQN